MRKLMVHNEEDDVGVVTEDISEEESMSGIYMDTGEGVEIRSGGEIPLGHKIALRDISEGEEITEYNTRIGVATQDISAGDYVHTHNIRSARWSFEGTQN